MNGSNSAAQCGQKTISNGGILAVVLVYAVFASAWILLSDNLVQLLFSDPDQIIIASMLKGWLFVIVTSALLYVLMRKWVVEDQATLLILHTMHLHKAFLGLLVLIVFITGIGISQNYHQETTEDINILKAVSDLKALQISNWLDEKQKGAEFVMSSEFFAQQYLQWQTEGFQASGLRLQQRLNKLVQTLSLASIAILDAKGHLLWIKEQSLFSISDKIQAAAQTASTEHKLIRLDPYQDSTGKVYLDFIVPLAVIPNASPLIVLHIDLQESLFPALFAWPTQANPGTTEFFVRQLDRIELFRTLPDKQIQVSQSNSAVNNFHPQLHKPGTENIILADGINDQGIAIIAVIRGIQNTNWAFVVERSKTDFNLGFAKHASLIAFTGFFAFFLACAGYYLVKQNQKLALTKALQEAQANQLQALQLLGALAESSDDAIFAKDLQGRYILFNRAACQFIDKPIAEVIGNDDRAIFPQHQAEMLMKYGQTIINEQKIITREETLQTVLGERIFLATKGPLRDSNNTIIGIFGISRDITELKRVEHALRESEERLRLTLEATNEGVWDWDLANNTAYFNPNYYAILGYRAEVVIPNFEFFQSTVFPEDLPRVMDAIYAHVQGKTLLSETEYRITTAAGEIKWLRGKGKVVARDSNGKARRMVGTIADISERKAIEDALRQQTQELAERNVELERFNRFTVGRELDMIALKQQVNELSISLGIKPPYTLDFLEPSAEPASTGEA